MTTLKVNVIRRPTIKVKVLPNFPSSVTASSPILLSKVGGNFAFSFDPSTIVGVQNLPAVAHQFVNAASGGFLQTAQPAASDITGLATSATVDTTNPLNINYVPGGTGSRTRTLQSKLKDFCNVLDFIPEAQHAAIQNFSTSYDATADIQACLTANGAFRPIYFPYGKYIVTSGLTFITTSSNSLTPGIRLLGDGANTIFDNRVGATARSDTFTPSNGSVIITVTRNAHGYAAQQQFDIQGASATVGGNVINGDWYINSIVDANNFTINVVTPSVGSTPVALTYSQINPMIDIDSNADLKFQQYVELSNFQIQNNTSPTLSTAIRFRRVYHATIENVWINGMTNDGIHITIPNTISGDRDGGNQITLRHCRIENCIRWGLNCDLRSGNNELSYLGIHDCFMQGNGAASGTLPPPSGGIKWKGQVCNIQQLALTTNQNVGLYIEGAAGLSNTFIVNGLTVENNIKKGIYITGLQSGEFTNIQIYNNDGNIATSGFMIDGTNFTCSNIRIRGAVVRATSGNNPYTAFNLTGANADAGTCRIEPGSVVFQTVGFPSAGQVAYTGWSTGSTTQQKLLTGSGTYTTPTGVKSIKVRMLGGGGGGAGSGTVPGAGGTGGTSTFGSSLLTCTGGAGGSTFNGGAGSTPTGGDLNLPGVTGQNGSGLASASTGGNGGVSFVGASGWGGAPGAGAGVAALANSGSGGGGGGVNATANGGGGGGASGYLEKIISNPLATYAWAVGAGGTNGTTGGSGAAGGAGGSGIIIVDEYY